MLENKTKVEAKEGARFFFWKRKDKFYSVKFLSVRFGISLYLRCREISNFILEIVIPLSISLIP
jgi:hypothetical protein